MISLMPSTSFVIKQKGFRTSLGLKKERGVTLPLVLWYMNTRRGRIHRRKPNHASRMRRWGVALCLQSPTDWKRS